MKNIWIFQLHEPLEAGRREKVETALRIFLSNWQAHGEPVPAKFNIHEERFILVHAQEDAASGCSIDRMFRETLGILESNGAKVAGPENVFYKNETGEVLFFHFLQAETMIKNGHIGPATIVYNSSITNEAEIASFESALKDTWLARFLAEKV